MTTCSITGIDDVVGIVQEYIETYNRAHAQAAFWIWHALSHGRAPDMVPQDCMRPSMRIVWVNDARATKPAEVMTYDEIEAAYAASAAEPTTPDWGGS